MGLLPTLLPFLLLTVEVVALEVEQLERMALVCLSVSAGAVPRMNSRTPTLCNCDKEADHHIWFCGDDKIHRLASIAYGRSQEIEMTGLVD